MFVVTQQTREQKELNAREREGQDASKITSAPARVMHPIALVSYADFHVSADLDGSRGDR